MNDVHTIYANKDNNICYNNDEIFETSINGGSNIEAIKYIFTTLFTHTADEKIIFNCLTNTDTNWTMSSLCKYLSDTYNKSERTYRRAINNLIDRHVVTYYLGRVYLSEDYNIGLYNLSNVKSIIIHINPNK